MTSSLCLSSYTKFLDVHSSPLVSPPKNYKSISSSSSSITKDWRSLAKGVLTSVTPTRNPISGSSYVTLSYHLNYRGLTTREVVGPCNDASVHSNRKAYTIKDKEIENARKQVEKELNVVAEGEGGSSTYSFEPSKVFGGRALGILSNRTHVVGSLEHIQQRAEVMYRERAYLHWYEREGIEKEDFMAAFENLDRVVEEYKWFSTKEEEDTTSSRSRPFSCSLSPRKWRTKLVED